MTTTPKSLSERLREMAEHLWDVEYRIHVDDDSKTILEAADALDAKDAEIEKLKRKIEDLHYEMKDEADRNWS